MWDNHSEYAKNQIDKFVLIMERSIDNFAPLKMETITTLMEKLPNWTEDQIVSTWYEIAIRKAFYASKIINDIPLNVIQNINSDNLLATTTKYRVPPLKLCNQVLQASGFLEKTVDKMIRDPHNLSNEKIREFICLALQNDLDTPVTWRWLRNKSREFEKQLEDLFRTLGLSFKVEIELMNEQIGQYGRSIATPDILFNETHTIVVSHPDGRITRHPVNWIDAKSYIFTGRKNVLEQLEKQAQSYISLFGPGAFIFQYGFINTINIENVVFLSDPLITWNNKKI